MGKYSHVVKDLPKFLGKDDSSQSRINDLKRQLREVDEKENADPIYVRKFRDALVDNIMDLFKELSNVKTDLKDNRFPQAYIETRNAIDLLEQAMKRLGELKTAYEQILIETFESRDITSLRTEGGLLSLVSEPYAQVEDKPAFRKWCIDNGYESQLALPWQTTNSILKERLLEGESSPDGIKPHVRDGIRLRRG